ncbi:PREDICTED: exocyst complex component EXO70B1-like [Camelina sativa]|uniref:Exocyst subunit Exo70 family protein n=1 Tax=Camelina sativa TaxID=90675 RepID=A0ABM0VAJ9_CAMSA|nr:PREDICTED: exocyst complex component EXO70B1-like [Camelina sativa]
MDKTESSETHVHKSEDHDHKKHSDESEQKLHSSTPESETTEASLVQVMEAVDVFIQELSSEKNDPLQEIPPAVEPFPETVDSLVSKMESSGLGRDETEDSVFIDAVNRISKSVMRLRELKLDSTPVSSWLNRASSVQHRAVSLLDEEFRHLLDRSREDKKKNRNNNDGNSSDHNHSSANESDRCALPDNDKEEEEEESFPDFSPESISTLKKIYGAMIFAGYESECCMSYEMSRRHAFKEELSEVGFEGINVEDVQRIAWESLEGEIASWISIVRRCSTLLFPGELSLCNTVFSDASIRKRLFTGLISAVTIRFLDFSGAVVLTKRSSEKLFKFLDMYETLRDLIPAVEQSDSDLIQEIKLAQTRLGEAAVTIFGELEKSIKSDNGRTPVPSGAVHPLTRYTMNYLKYACEYKETLDQVFQHYESNQTDTIPEPETKPKQQQREDDEEYKTSAYARQMIRVMELLDANLDIKSKLYRDPSLRYIFLMNNGRYILQKIKGSTEIRDLMGQSWTRKRSTELRQYHKSYQRETWGKVLQCMNQEGLQVNGKVSKPVLKERFKIFNAMFDEIHKTQSTWIVSDEQMQSELRVSISALVIPAYRSFFGRYKQHLDSGKQTDKYVKYQPEDIESFIDDLFDGNHPTSLARKRN